jgi:predicted SAM-dependent methyltransferase
MGLRINVGCGRTPTKGWRNFDNSAHVRLSKIGFLRNLLEKRWFDRFQRFIPVDRADEIEIADAAGRLPVEDGSADVLYTSHMVEHLDSAEVELFLREAMRVLRPGGIIRVGVPDLEGQIARYLQSRDADAFMEETHLCVPRPRTLAQRLRLLLVGTRHHQWMYDGRSLSALLRKHGFVAGEVMPAGRTRISDHEPLDLHERADESVFVEAEKAGAARIEVPDVGELSMN